MANTKISALTALTNPTWSEEFVYAYNNANGKVTLNTMKSFIAWWWGGVTTLNADANIWELAEWFYETTYNLYYKEWEKVPSNSLWTRKQMLFVTSEWTGEKWFLVFNVWHNDTTYYWRASFWYSISSSQWICKELNSEDYVLKLYEPWPSENAVNSFQGTMLTQIVSEITSGTNNLRISSSVVPYPWVTYSIYIDSVAAGQTYTIGLGNWITNPLNIALPTASDKKCFITVLITSTTTGIVTWCTIES